MVLPKVQQPLEHPYHPVQFGWAGAIGRDTFDALTLARFISGIAQLAGVDVHVFQAEAVPTH